jgi:O-antigen/teichoic acid export membrane protein
MRSDTATFWRNTASVLSGTVVAQAIPLVGTLIMARLYAPAHFGTFAAWLAIVTVLAVALTGRFESSLAVVDDGEARETAFFVTLATVGLFGMAAMLIVAVLAAVAPALLGMPPLLMATLVPAAIAYALSQSWESYAAAEGSYRWLSILRIVQAALVLAIQVGTGIVHPSAEALACAFTLGVGLTLLVSSRVFPASLPPAGTRWAKLRAFWREQHSFPMFALPADTINTFSAQLPILIVASRFGADYAGYLAMTIRLLGAPVTLLGRSVLDVFKRYASASFRAKGHCREEYLQTLRTLALGALAFCIGMLWLGKTAFVLLLGSKWSMAGEMAIWLLPLFSLRFVASPLSYTFYIVGKQHFDLAWQVVLLAMTVATLNIAAGADTALKTYAYGYSLLYLAYIYLSYRCSLGTKQMKSTV